MRVGKLLQELKIGLPTLNAACKFLNINSYALNSKLSDYEIEVLTKAINNPEFNETLKTQKNLISHLFYNSKTEINETLASEILDALRYAIKLGLIRQKNQSQLEKILQSDKSVLDKISDLKKLWPFAEQKKFNEKEFPKSRPYSNDYYDPHENYEWGGLSGEEA